MKSARTIVMGLMLSVAVGGCQPRYHGLEVSRRGGLGEFTGGKFIVAEGQVLAVRVRPVSDNPYEDYERFDIVTMESDDETIAVVAPAISIAEFVLVGRSVGRTSLTVSINGREEDTLDVEIVAQGGAQ